MGKIKVTNCDDIEGLKVIEPTVFGDSRGYFMETYNYNDFKEAGIDVEFVQDNQSSSRYGVLRGPKLMENGTELFFQQRIRNSFLFRKDLHMASWFFLRMRSLLINAPIFIIQTMRAV